MLTQFLSLSAASKMQAIIWFCAPIASSEFIHMTNHPDLSPKEGHVLIRIKAYGLNRSELFTRQGHSLDAGGGSRCKEGNFVVACMGGMGRQFNEPMGWAVFAAVPEMYLTAWGTLSKSLKLQSTDTLLICEGTTSVELACALLAKSPLFASDIQPTMLATTRSERKVPALKATGVDTVLINSGKVSEEVKKATAGKGAQKCVELVGGTTLTDSCQSLTDDGLCSMIGCVSGEWTVKELDPMSALQPSKHLTICSSGFLDISKAPMQWIVNAIAFGELKPSVDKVFKMEETAKAHHYMETNLAAGKVVCIVD
ncbi:hypothetical protein DAEQUDRAFT_757632 [Daedalea quercina L-15889]|uniref:Enoyl reductase (ER) domain-containing protein n=1 Tax=Daedalea quercina L-15889 TaxID=1314783 RepID=A0A165PN71_9APHY|nr:hypothetical protein DAEQUDRAFT_757632 [Daedalea quercina L-15889]